MSTLFNDPKKLAMEMLVACDQAYLYDLNKVKQVHVDSYIAPLADSEPKNDAPLPYACAPGMARYFIGVSPMARFSQSRRQGEGQGRRREAGSEGSPIRNCGAMNKNRI